MKLDLETMEKVTGGDYRYGGESEQQRVTRELTNLLKASIRKAKQDGKTLEEYLASMPRKGNFTDALNRSAVIDLWDRV